MTDNKYEEIAESLGKHTKKLWQSTKARSENLYDNSSELLENYWENQQATSAENWYQRTADACERMADAIMHESGWTDRAVSLTSRKLAAAAVPASVFSVAALVGTASTGTAIGTLSGAAFTSSALAWVGGSVVMGTAVIGAASLVGALVAPIAVMPVAKKYITGQKRNIETLNTSEAAVLDACTALVLGIRQAEKEIKELSGKDAKLLNHEVLSPLLIKAAEVLVTSDDWPLYQRNKFKNTYMELVYQTGFASKSASDIPPIAVSVATVLFLKLLSDDRPTFTENETDILDAIRRSSNKLNEASNEEIADYVQALEPYQMIGFGNNVKGIAHEIRFARNENSDGDEYVVELFDATNNPGADVRIINQVTGMEEEFQLKATSSASYLEAHFEKYPDISVLATTEVAWETSVASSGVSNNLLKEDFDRVVDKFQEGDQSIIFESLAATGITTLAYSVSAILRTEPSQTKKRAEFIEDGVKAGLVAGIVELLV